MKVFLLLNAFSFVILYSSCTDDPLQSKESSFIDKDGLQHINVYESYNDTNNNLSAYASDIKFVKIDNEFPLISFHVKDVVLSKDYIFLLFRNKNILQYSSEGSFIRRIGSKGKGPGEYINLTPPLAVDKEKEFIYVNDIRLKKILTYDFKGTFRKEIKWNYAPEISCIDIINSSTFAVRQTAFNRYKPDCPSIRFIDTNCKIKKSYPSILYPLPREKFEDFGSTYSFLWRHKDKIYTMEYGSDTVFQIEADSIYPSRVFTGKLKMTWDEHFGRRVAKGKMDIRTTIFRPDDGIIESDGYIIFKILEYDQVYYLIYNKKENSYSRTNYDLGHKSSKESEISKMDYFIDDLATGLPAKLQYESEGKLLTFISALEIVEKRQEILNYLDKQSFSEKEKLRDVIEKMTEDDNDLLTIVTLK